MAEDLAEALPQTFLFYDVGRVTPRPDGHGFAVETRGYQFLVTVSAVATPTWPVCTVCGSQLDRNGVDDGYVHAGDSYEDHAPQI